jgi:DNA-binding NtrC family response regulator
MYNMAKQVSRKTPFPADVPALKNLLFSVHICKRRFTMRKKILVVDDELHIRLLYQEELEGGEYSVALTDGRTPIMEVIAKEKPDAVILDIKLEGNPLTGLDILQIIRAADSALPVILSTSYDSFQYDLKSIAADAYVVKSVDLTMLKDTIKRVFAEKKA